MKKYLIAIVILMANVKLFGQDSTQNNPLIISGYAEVYYSYDFNNPVNNTKASFLYSYNRNNEVNLDLGFIKAGYYNNRVRANLALAAGTYMNANYAAEPGVLKNIYEANAGVKLSPKSELWLDAGIFGSHIGFESAIGKDCWTLTRSILAENLPYFETGVKLGYTSANSKWFLSGLLLNGWQRIQRVDGNTTPAFGVQLTFKPSDKVALNYSNFIGNDKPDSIRQMRYFHDFYGLFQVSDLFGITAGFDYGMEQRSKGSSDMNGWYAPVVIFRVTPGEKDAVAARFEYYSDEHGVIISSGTSNDFKTFGWSVNYDRKLFGNTLWRIEVRGLSGKDAYFTKKDLSTTDNSVFVTTSLAVGF